MAKSTELAAMVVEYVVLHWGWGKDRPNVLVVGDVDLYMAVAKVAEEVYGTEQPVGEQKCEKKSVQLGQKLAEWYDRRRIKPDHYELKKAVVKAAEEVYGPPLA